MEQETIAAIATPFGSGGIGIIRLSGSQATAIAGQLFQRSRSGQRETPHSAIELFTSHHLTHGYIFDGDLIVDEVLLVFMKAPRSYTGEDVVEIQSHSGAIILNRILKLTLEQGARLADPGEFTKRAYLNERIDLSQAEAVSEIIAAKSEASLRISMTQLTGAMKSQIEQFGEQLNQIMAQLQAHLEFSDEIENTAYLQGAADQLGQELIGPIQRLLAQYNNGHMLREGVRMGIVGRPNVGKSSLLNYLLRKERAIVTHMPGTTRDIIEDSFTISGIPIIVTDTAGLHVTENPVEKIGIEKTHEYISLSDLVLFVVDGSQPHQDEDDAVYLKIQSKNVIMVVNKVDLVQGQPKYAPPEKYDDIPRAEVSALTGEGVEKLKALVAGQCAGGVEIEPGGAIIPSLRQKVALDLGLGALERARAGLINGLSEEFIVEDLETAQKALNQISGKNIEVDILDEIFSRFCIGK